MQFLQLLWFHFRRRIRHHIASGLVLGEGDHFADVRFVRQQHDQAVDAGGHAAVRRRAVLERFSM